MSDIDPEADPPTSDRESSSYWTRIEEILDHLAGVAPADLDDAIAECCGDDVELTQEVRSLLAHLPDPEDDAGETLRLDLEAFDPTSIVGRDLGGFRIESIIGAGGHGVVYRGLQERPRRAVAVKVVPSPTRRFRRARSAILTRFEHEVEALARIDHVGVARIIAAGIDASTGRPLPFIVSELVERPRDLVSWWADTDEFVLRLSVLIDVADAVQEAHGVGVLHRDLKPGNVLVDPQGRSKVIDFGIAGILDARRRVRDELRGGTAAFTSPEQMTGVGEVTVRSDVFALGRLLAACLDHRPPERGTSMRERRAASDLRAIAGRASAEDPVRRYTTVAGFAMDLRRVVDGHPAMASEPGLLRILGASTRRHPVIASTSIIGALLVVAMLATASVFWRVAVRAERQLEIENRMLDEALASEAASLRRERLTVAALAVDTPIIARAALDAIGEEHDDLAVRILRHRFADPVGVDGGTGVNAYRIRAIDGGRVVSGAADGRIRIYGRAESTPFRILESPSGQVFGTASSRDGRSVAAVTSTGTMHHWRLDERGEVIKASEMTSPAGGMIGLAHHPVDPVIAYVEAGDRGRVLDLSVDPPAVLATVEGVDAQWGDADFSPDGRRLVISGLSSGVVLLERDPDGRWVELGRHSAGDLVRKARFSPDGGRLAIGGGRSIAILDVDALRVRQRRSAFDTTIWGLGWSPRGDRLAIGGWGQRLVLLDAGTLETVRTLLGADGPIWSIAWPDDDLLATGEENAAIRWWSTRDAMAGVWRLPSGVTELIGIENQDVLASDDHGGLHRLRCDGSVETVLHPLESICRSTVTDGGFAQIRENTLRWHDLAGEVRTEVALQRTPITVDRLVPSPDGRWVGAILDGADLVIFETHSGRIAFETVIESGVPTPCRWDADGRFVLPRSWSPDDDAISTEWRIDPVSGSVSGPPYDVRLNIRASFDIPGGWVSAMRTDDEFTVRTGRPGEAGEAGEASEASRAVHRDQAHAGGVDAFAVADGGATLITAGVDGQVRLWAMPDVEPLLTLRSQPESSVRCLTVVDDRWLLVGHADGTVIRYDAVPPRSSGDADVAGGG